MKRLLPLLFLVVLGSLAGCNRNANQCRALCSKFVNTCEWPAWTSVEQCEQGCIDDLYRRDDADELLACYHAAADAPTDEVVEAAVDRGIAAGVYDVQIAQGSFDRDAAKTVLSQRMTCDAFAAVECKTEAVLQEPNLPLVRETVAE